MPSYTIPQILVSTWQGSFSEIHLLTHLIIGIILSYQNGRISVLCKIRYICCLPSNYCT